MQPNENDQAYLAQSVALREEMLSIFRLAREDVATTDLGGSQELMRTALPPGREPERRKHPLDGEQGLGLDDPDAHSAHARTAQEKPRKSNEQDSDADADSDAETADDEDGDSDDDQKED